MATLDEAIGQMLANGMPPFPNGAPRVDSGKIVRYGPKKNAWYRLFAYRSKSGRTFIQGAYGIWGQLDKTKIETDWTGIDDLERARIQKQQREEEEIEIQKRELQARNALNRAREQLIAAKATGESPYLQKKGVVFEPGLKFGKDGLLLVPMYRYDTDGKPDLKGVQKIDAEGNKLFNKGMAKEGAAFTLGANPKSGSPILLVEGLATGLSIRQAIGRSRPVVVAFDAGNLLPVAKIFRAKYPKCPILICADDDFQTVCDKHKAEGLELAVAPGNRPDWCRCNPGRTRAEAAAQTVGNAITIFPEFKARGENRWTDFNDLHKFESLYAVEKQLTAALQKLPDAGERKKKKDEDPLDWGLLDKMVKRFSLIYPSDAAWDETIGAIVKIEHMRNMFGKALVNIWLMHQDRRSVLYENVVFDPKGKHDPKISVNLFRGLAVDKTRATSCDLLLGLLHYLCGEDDKVFDWVLQWTAYPLQHLGAKMQTGVVMYGDEGTGKNLFWGTVGSIYGRHGGIITQQQLQSQFNDWLSAQLFLVANEVVTRQELKHHVGYLKNLITEPEVMINPKNLPLRREANHANMVFLSNELQPLMISPGDRRYQVIRTPPIRDEAYYKKVSGEADHGGMEAFYLYLMKMDLGEFNEHTKPIMTDAKRDLIDLGLSSTQLFWRELHAELVPLPYAPCLVTDLYKAYRHWCGENGEKMPTKMERFSQEFMSMNGVRRRVKRVRDPDRPGEDMLVASKVPQRTVFLMGLEPTAPDQDGEVLDHSIREFRTAFKVWTKPAYQGDEF